MIKIKLLIKVLLMASFYYTSILSACTIGVASGAATVDGRPLLWKNRDKANLLANRVIHNTDSLYTYSAVTSNDNDDAWMGINAAGFAIVNSLSRDLMPTRLYANGALMSLALGNCASVEDFEAVLADTTITRFTASNYACIDTLGNATIFETASRSYTRYDASEAPQNYLVRTNFSLSGGDDNGIERYTTSNNIISGLIAQDSLSFQSLIKQHSRALSTSENELISIPATAPVTPYGYVNIEYSMSRQHTVSASIIRGVNLLENPLYTCMWIAIANPLASIFVPIGAGTPPPSSLTAIIGESSPLGAVSTQLYGKLFNNNDLLDTYLLKNSQNEGIWDLISQTEADIFLSAESIYDVSNDDNVIIENMSLISHNACNLALTCLTDIQLDLSPSADFAWEAVIIDGDVYAQIINKSLHMPYAYQWFVGDDEMIDYVDVAPLIPLTAGQATRIKLRVINEHGSDEYSEFISKTMPNIVSIANIPTVQLTSISPNPVSSPRAFSVLLTANNQSKIELGLYNIRGQLVQKIYAGAIRNGESSFTAGNTALSSGVYFVKLTNEKEQSTKKITIIK